MDESSLSALSWLVTTVLSMAVLPSWTAVSVRIYERLGLSSSLLGPINPLKIAAPALLIFLYTQRTRISEFLPKGLALFLGVTYLLGSGAVLYGAFQCQWNLTLFREWFLHGWAALWALSFFFLSNRQRKWVIGAWLTWVGGSCLMDWLAPAWQDWLFAHIFDPDTRVLDVREVGDVLTGVFGRQTLGKFLAWIPWLWLLTLKPVAKPSSQRFRFALGMAAVIFSAGIVLATSQRGPFVSVLAAALVTIVLYARNEGFRKRTLLMMIGGFALSVGVLTVSFVPRPILESRIRSMIGLSSTGSLGDQAEQNTKFRWGMLSFSTQVILENPMGRACFPNERYFWDRGTTAGHAHHLFLQEYRARGWIWGTLHLLMWIFCGWAFFRALPSAQENFFWFGGFLSIVFVGQFDYPWMALSQSIVIWVFLWKGFSLWGSLNIRRWSRL